LLWETALDKMLQIVDRFLDIIVVAVNALFLAVVQVGVLVLQ
jgi:hypothetical protein